ncbi:MAG: DMT family transporter [Spirulinaceae cyanobacterium]
MLQSVAGTVNPKFLLVFSRALAALRPALIAFLVINATRLSGGMDTPISFCNVLFVGNLCAALAVLAWFGAGNIWQDVRSLDRNTLLGLTINGCLAAALSSLIFSGLTYTTVTNAVLLGRFGPVLYAVIGAVIFKRQIQKWEWFGFGFILAGILTIVLISNQFQVNRGDLLILGSSLCYCATSIIGKLMLRKNHNLRIVVFSRNFVSSVIFFAIASILFGPEHFSEAFAGQLWGIMIVYAILIIVMAQFMWYSALDRLDSKTVGKWTVLSPVFGVTYAFLLNGERPSLIQVIAFMIIMIGVLMTTLGKQVKRDSTATIAVAGESCSAAT